MKDLRERLEKLCCDAEECDLIAKLATDKIKRAVFERLADKLRAAAADLEIAIAEKKAAGET